MALEASPSSSSYSGSSGAIEKPENIGKLTINADAAENWIAKYDETDQPALRELVDKIVGVSFPEFCRNLGNGIEAVRKTIKETPTFLVARRKSNEWVAKIGAKYSNFKGIEMDLGHDDASDFVNQIANLPPKKVPAEIVLFDDASYSGNQMSRHVAAIVNAMKDKLDKPKKITVIVPFMTKMALDKLCAIKLPKNLRLVIAPHQRILTVKEAVSKESYQTLSKLFDYLLPPDTDSGVTVTYMAHKIPNSQSFFSPLQQENILPRIRVPYG